MGYFEHSNKCLDQLRNCILPKINLLCYFTLLIKLKESMRILTTDNQYVKIICRAKHFHTSQPLPHSSGFKTGCIPVGKDDAGGDDHISFSPFSLTSRTGNGVGAKTKKYVLRNKLPRLV
jgi:hypothetical protein